MERIWERKEKWSSIIVHFARASKTAHSRETAKLSRAFSTEFSSQFEENPGPH